MGNSWSEATLSNHDDVIHYGDVIMGAIASQITSLTIVYPAVYSDADQRKHQSSVSLAFVRRIHRGPVNSPHKWPVTLKMFPFDDVIMQMETFSDKGQWRGALEFSLIWVWINGSVNNREAGDFRRYRAHYDVTVVWNTLYMTLLPSELLACVLNATAFQRQTYRVHFNFYLHEFWKVLLIRHHPQCIG